MNRKNLMRFTNTVKRIMNCKFTVLRYKLKNLTRKKGLNKETSDLTKLIDVTKGDLAATNGKLKGSQKELKAAMRNSQG